MEKWLKILYGARSRCKNPKAAGYKYYGGKGIKCFLTKKQAKFLWERDKGYSLRKPSIDRINSMGNYELINCRFIEVSENSKLALGPKTEKICKQCGKNFIGIKKKIFCNAKCNVRYFLDIYVLGAATERIEKHIPRRISIEYWIELGEMHLKYVNFDFLQKEDQKMKAKEKLKETIAKVRGK